MGEPSYMYRVVTRTRYGRWMVMAGSETRNILTAAAKGQEASSWPHVVAVLVERRQYDIGWDVVPDEDLPKISME